MNTTMQEQKETVKPLSLAREAAKVCTNPEMQKQMVETALWSLGSTINDRKEALAIREMELGKDIHHVAELVHKLSTDFREYRNKTREYETLCDDYDVMKADYLKGGSHE